MSKAPPPISLDLAPPRLFLFTQTPEIKNWALSVHPGRQLVVGGYAYLMGDKFPRVALAMDAIIAEV